MSEKFEILQERAREGSFISISIPTNDLDLAEEICKEVLSYVRTNTIVQNARQLEELERKNKKLRELGVDPDLV